MDIIFLNDLKVETVIGVFDWERKIKQEVILDLELGYDIRAAAASDELADTLDYKALSKRLSDFISHSDYQLVETLAERCAELIQKEFGVGWLRLRVNKPGALTAAGDVGVLIERGHRR